MDEKISGGQKMPETRTNIDDFLTVRGFGGWGAGGGWGGGHGSFAGPSSNAVRIDSIGQKVEDQADCTRGILGQQFQTISSQFENATRDRQFNALQNELFQSELRTRDLFDAKGREDNARFAALDKCCCDALLQACEDKAELKAEILAVEARTVAHDRDKAERMVERLQLQNACGCCPPT